MITDMLVSQIQLALIGIVVVLGLFFVWRSLHRMEDKLDRLTDLCTSNTHTTGAGWDTTRDDIDDVANMDADMFMRSVFGGGDNAASSVVFSSPITDQQCVKDPVVIEEIVCNENNTHEAHDKDERSSEADTDTANPLSKYKLKKMPIDTLKELCKERGLTAEGSRAVLTDRLLGLVRD